MDLKTAKQVIFNARAHFNFGNNVEARRRHYQRIEQACRVTEAGYVLKPDGFGYRITNEN